MEAVLAWFNARPTTDPVIKAAPAHLWFVTIHPFEDGNGWIARATGLCCTILPTGHLDFSHFSLPQLGSTV